MSTIDLTSIKPDRLSQMWMNHRKSGQRALGADAKMFHWAMCNSIERELFIFRKGKSVKWSC